MDDERVALWENKQAREDYVEGGETFERHGDEYNVVVSCK